LNDPRGAADAGGVSRTQRRDAQRTQAFRSGVIEPGVIEPGVIEPGVIEPGVIEPGVIRRDAVGCAGHERGRAGSVSGGVFSRS
jgi:hypothetical protein